MWGLLSIYGEYVFSSQPQTFPFILMVMLMAAGLYLNSCSFGLPGFVTQTFSPLLMQIGVWRVRGGHGRLPVRLQGSASPPQGENTLQLSDNVLLLNNSENTKNKKMYFRKIRNIRKTQLIKNIDNHDFRTSITLKNTRGHRPCWGRTWRS